GPRRQAPAAGGSPRIGLNRAGRRRGDVRLPRELLPRPARALGQEQPRAHRLDGQGREAARPRRGHHRQAAPRADRHGGPALRGQLHQILRPGARAFRPRAGRRPGRQPGNRLRCRGVLVSLRALLTIDLDAIVANWWALDAMTGFGCETAAVVKADGYGLGAARVGRALAGAGCRTFFVAVPTEGEALRAAIGPDPVIYIL